MLLMHQGHEASGVMPTSTRVQGVEPQPHGAKAITAK